WLNVVNWLTWNSSLASGSAASDEFQVNQFTTFNQQAPSVAMDAQGDFAIAWQSYGQDGSGYGIFVRRYNSAGVALSNEYQVNQFTTGNQWAPTVAMDARGDFVIAWQNRGLYAESHGIFARRYDASGNARADAFQVNQASTFHQASPSVAMDAQGE